MWASWRMIRTTKSKIESYMCAYTLQLLERCLLRYKIKDSISSRVWVLIGDKDKVLNENFWFM